MQSVLVAAAVQIQAAGATHHSVTKLRPDASDASTAWNVFRASTEVGEP